MSGDHPEKSPDVEYRDRLSVRLAFHEKRIAGLGQSATAALPTGPAWQRCNGRWRLGWATGAKRAFVPFDAAEFHHRLLILEQIESLEAAVREARAELDARTRAAVTADEKKYGADAAALPPNPKP